MFNPVGDGGRPSSSAQPPKIMAKRKKTTYPTPQSCKFNSVYELASWLDNTPVGESWSGHEDSKDPDSEFAGSASYEEADGLMLKGWDSGADDVKKIMFERAENVERVQRLTISYVGVMPCVPAYLAGSPAHMLAVRQRPTKRPVVTICYNCAVGSKVAAKDITTAAAKLLNVIRGLEAGGVAVNLWVCCLVTSGDQKITLAVKIKESNEPFNVLNMAYPLIHPSFLRRHFLAFEERSGAHRDAWSCYGAPVVDRDETKREVAALGIADAVCLSYYNLRGADEAEILKMIQQ